MNNLRLIRLDSWRAICCLGVLWIHCWHLLGSIPINVFGFNIAKPMSILGNGVDFFFVISGFCMYYFYINKLKILDKYTYKNFILSRFYRIIPAFIISLIIYGLLLKSNNGLVELLKLIFLNVITFQNFSSAYEISSHFWSIAIEWHFYLVFPFIIFLKFKYYQFLKGLGLLTLIISLFGVLLLTIDKGYDIQLPVRFVEFAVGIALAYIYKQKEYIKTNYIYLLIGFALLFIGRLLNVDPVLNYSNSAWVYSPVKISGYGLMTSGFAVLLYYSIHEQSNIFSFLTWKPLVFIGKISYSFYLWHGIVVIYVWKLFNELNLFNNLSQMTSVFIQFITCIALTIPIAYLSYYFVERKFKYNAKN